MNADLILIRYGELSLKSSYVRHRFISILEQNITHTFRSHSISCSVQKEWGRLYLYTNDISSAIPLLQKTFGITSISPAIQTTDDIQDISKHAISMIKHRVKKNNSFALRVTRTGTHRYTSQDVAITVGEVIRKATQASVDLTKPDVELFIEIRGTNSYLFFEKIRGYGGLPMGTQGIVTALIDSPQSLLAAWYLMRRGCKIIFVTPDKSLVKQIHLFVEQWNVLSPVIHTFDQKTIISEIQKIHEKQRAYALVTGHILANSSAVQEIARLKKQIGCPIFSPLIALDNKELKKKCDEVGLPV